MTPFLVSRSGSMMSDLHLPAVLHAPHTVGEFFVRAVRRYRDRPAIRFRGKTLTYAQMGEGISRLFQALSDAGVGRGTAVCALISNRPETIMVRAAVLLLGARYTPLNPLGSLPDHIFVTADAQADLLIIEDRYAAMLGPITKEADVGKVLTVGPVPGKVDLLAMASTKTPEPLRCLADPIGIAGITYTGGTTGRPKGIIFSHRVLVMNVLMALAEWDWPARPNMALMTPMAHAAGYLTLPIIVKGGIIHIEDGFDPDVFIAAVERDRISTTFLVPTMIHALVNHPRIRTADLSSLSLIIYGAAPISAALLTEAIGIFGPVFLQLYAQSEAPMTVTTLNLDDHLEGGPDRFLSCGFPMTGVDVRLLDDDGHSVAIGEVGEICVRGPLVMDGYWNRPDETEKTLKDGWLHTGDLAREDEAGYLYIVDRKKDMIISGGFNVYPKEVEDALTRHPAVAQAAVFGVPDDKWGEAVKAAIVLRAPDSATERDLIEHVRALKGPVAAPKSIDFIEDMPQTSLGKPDKQALRAPYWRDARRNVG